MFQLKSQVLTSACDENGQLRFDAAMDMMQDCSVLWTESESKYTKYLIDNNLIMILVNRQADVLRIPLYKECLTIETRIYECKGALGLRNTVIYDADNKSCIVSWATGAFVDNKTARPVRLPQDITCDIKIDPKIEMEYLGRKIDIPKEDGKKLEPVIVTALDIDTNRHMNNGRYIKAAMKFLPDDFIISKFRIEYKKPAIKGNLLYPVVKRNDKNKIYMLLNNETETPYTIMEFTGAD